MIKINQKSGFALVEILVVAGLLVVFTGALAVFSRDLFVFNERYNLSFSADSNAKSALKRLTAELRAAETSAMGGFPIESAATNSIIFFSDPDKDGVRERLRYYIENGSLVRSITEPKGNPASYFNEDEKSQDLIVDLLTASSSFLYFGNNYDGSASSSPLLSPINPQDIKMARFVFVIQASNAKAPTAYVVQSEVMIRNLKDNW